jgi:hypothetical protein
MPSLQNILSNSARVVIQTGDGDLHVDYYPSRVTQELITKFNAIQKRAEEDVEDAKALFLETNALFISLVKAWDMMDEKPCEVCAACKAGNECVAKEEFVFELEPNNLLRFPLEIVRSITEAIFNDPNRKATQKKK